MRTRRRTHRNTSRWSQNDISASSLCFLSSLSLGVIFPFGVLFFRLFFELFLYVINSIFEAFDTFAKALHKLWNFLSTKKEKDYKGNNDNFSTTKVAQK